MERKSYERKDAIIVFHKIRWANFLSTGNLFTEVQLDRSNTMLIVGENGAGKSTLLDALTFGLFGKPFRDINKPQLVNSITKKNTMVEVEFSIGKTEYVVRRGMKPTVFEVYKNGQLINQSAESRDYQQVLERQILKLNYKSFCQVVVLGSATYTPFMKLPPARRREIVEDLLDLQMFSTMNSLLKDRASRTNEEIASLSAEARLVEERIRLAREHAAEMMDERRRLAEEKMERLREATRQLEEKRNLLTTLTEQIEELQTHLDPMEKLRRRARKLEEYRYRIESRVSALQKNISFFHDNDTCPTCSQSIGEDFKNERIETHNSEIRTVEEGLVKLTEEYDKISAEISELLLIQKNLTDLELEQYAVQNSIRSLQSYQRELVDDVRSLTDVREIERSTSTDDNEDSLEKIKSALAKADDAKKLHQVAATLLKDSGIKARIIKQYVPIINKLINKYLSSMDFFVQFEIDEEFNETIRSRYRDEFSYGSFSEGEKQRINLAILFAWRAVAKLRNSVATNLMIMDEVFDSSMDSIGADALIDIIKHLSPDTNIIVISHKEQMVDKFQEIIKFVKRSNFSSIAA